jgi:hypothetical protein
MIEIVYIYNLELYELYINVLKLYRLPIAVVACVRRREWRRFAPPFSSSTNSILFSFRICWKETFNSDLLKGYVIGIT